MSSSFFMENQYPDEAKREEIANACNSVIQKPGSKRGSSVKRTFLSSENTSCWIDVSWQVISRWRSSLLVFFFFFVKMLPTAYRTGTPAAFLSCTSFINTVGESKSFSFFLEFLIGPFEPSGDVFPHHRTASPLLNSEAASKLMVIYQQFNSLSSVVAKGRSSGSCCSVTAFDFRLFCFNHSAASLKSTNSVDSFFETFSSSLAPVSQILSYFWGSLPADSQAAVVAVLHVTQLPFQVSLSYFRQTLTPHCYSALKIHWWIHWRATWTSTNSRVVTVGCFSPEWEDILDYHVNNIASLQAEKQDV